MQKSRFFPPRRNKIQEQTMKISVFCFLAADIPYAKPRGRGVRNPPDHASSRVGARPGHAGCAPPLSRPRRPGAFPGKWIHTPVSPTEPGSSFHYNLKKSRGTRWRASWQWVTYGRRPIDCSGVSFYPLHFSWWRSESPCSARTCSCLAAGGHGGSLPSATWTQVLDHALVLDKRVLGWLIVTWERMIQQDLSDLKWLLRSLIHCFRNSQCSLAFGSTKGLTWVESSGWDFGDGSSYQVPRSLAFVGLWHNVYDTRSASTSKEITNCDTETGRKNDCSEPAEENLEWLMVWNIPNCVIYCHRHPIRHSREPSLLMQ